MCAILNITFLFVLLGVVPCNHKVQGLLSKCTDSICVNVYQCPYFADLLRKMPRPRPPHFISLMRVNSCGYEDSVPKICCKKSWQNKVMDNSMDTPDVTSHANLLLLPNRNCGRSQVTNDLRITGGATAALMEYPWMALLAYNTVNNPDYKCGGTLINDRYVLTAAHCIVNLNLIGVRLGEHDLDNRKDCDELTGLCAPPVQDFYVEEVIVHPQYSMSTSSNDIALIRLATPANFSYANVQPICLPVHRSPTEDLVGKVGIISGWGVMENGYKSEVLLKTSIPIVPIENCSKIYRAYAPVTYKQICAGGSSGRDSCGGDSGGPLKYVSIRNGIPHYFQTGVVSYGPRICGAPGQPAVYTNVVYYMKWILDNLRPSGD